MRKTAASGTRRKFSKGRGWSHWRLVDTPQGPFAVQAAIAALHAQAPCAADTDWAEIVGLYSLLLQL